MPPGRRRAPPRTRAVLYGRQSIDDEDSISLELQLGANREYAARHGYDVVAELDDPGISGRRWSNRPRAVEALRMVTDREADVIVAWKWSRISRNRLDFEIAIDRAESSGGRIESATEPIDVTTASGRFARGMLAGVAVFESERIGEGWRETHASRRKRGVPAQGGDRYGYRRVDGGYVIDESQAEALRLAYGWFVAGWGPNRIVRELNRRGFRNRIGEPFKRFGLYGLLDSGFAAGLIVHTPRDREGRPVGEPEYTPGAHPPIIDEQTWEAYRATRRANQGQPPRLTSSPHPLSGLMRCGDCGAAMAVYSKPRAGSKKPATYACVRWRNWGSEWVRCVTISAPRAERLVREWLEGIAGDAENAAQADRRIKRRHRQARAEAERVGQRVTALETQLADLAVMRVRGEIAVAGYDEARTRLEAELEVARSAVEEAELAASRQPSASRTTAVGLLELWDLVPAEDIRHGLGRLLRGLWVYPPTKRGHGAQLAVIPLWAPAPDITRPELADVPDDRV